MRERARADPQPGTLAAPRSFPRMGARGVFAPNRAATQPHPGAFGRLRSIRQRRGRIEKTAPTQQPTSRCQKLLRVRFARASRVWSLGSRAQGPGAQGPAAPGPEAQGPGAQGPGGPRPRGPRPRGFRLQARGLHGFKPWLHGFRSVGIAWASLGITWASRPVMPNWAACSTPNFHVFSSAQNRAFSGHNFIMGRPFF